MMPVKYANPGYKIILVSINIEILVLGAESLIKDGTGEPAACI